MGAETGQGKSKGYTTNETTNGRKLPSGALYQSRGVFWLSPGAPLIPFIQDSFVFPARGRAQECAPKCHKGWGLSLNALILSPEANGTSRRSFYRFLPR